MMGLAEEGQQVMEEEEKKEDAAADLALIGPLTRFRRPGISRSSLRQKAIVVLLEKADQLLNQVAPSLMPVAKMPAAVEQATIDGAE